MLHRNGDKPDGVPDGITGLFVADAETKVEKRVAPLIVHEVEMTADCAKCEEFVPLNAHVVGCITYDFDASITSVETTTARDEVRKAGKAEIRRVGNSDAIGIVVAQVWN